MNTKDLNKIRKRLPYYEKSIERDAILFKWKSNTPDFRLPFQPEMKLSMNGSIGWDKIHNCWVMGAWEELRDEYGDYLIYICHTLNTENIRNYQLKNHKEVIVCGNTPLYRSFEAERRFYSEFKDETDKSIYCQLLNSRLNKALVADSDNQKKQIELAYEAVKLGFPMIIVTQMLEGIEAVDLTDPNDIEKMQYLSSFYQNMEKREVNDAGIDLDLLDKRAQVSTTEIKQYNDFTTLEYLMMFEMRQSFVEEMKENGIDIEIVRNPVFFDEPTASDVDEGTFEAAEAEEEEAPGESQEENNEEEENEDARDNA